MVTTKLSQFNWHVGRCINARLLQGQRSDYCKQVVAELARQLTAEFGMEWKKRQLRYYMHVAEVFLNTGILHILCFQLSGSHLQPVIYIENTFKRDCYVEIYRI